VEILHFPAETSWNAVQAFLDRKFGNEWFKKDTAFYRKL
jgi:hypothetical protein